MSDEVIAVRNALVEAIASQKIIKERLAKQKDDLATWKTRIEKLKQDSSPVPAEIEQRVRQIELTIAQYEADLMAQSDLEKQLRATVSRLENSVAASAPSNVPDSQLAEETIERMEKKIFEKEAVAELGHNAKDEKLAKQAADLAIEEELEQLKKSMEKKD